MQISLYMKLYCMAEIIEAACNDMREFPITIAGQLRLQIHQRNPKQRNNKKFCNKIINVPGTVPSKDVQEAQDQELIQTAIPEDMT